MKTLVFTFGVDVVTMISATGQDAGQAVFATSSVLLLQEMKSIRKSGAGPWIAMIDL